MGECGCYPGGVGLGPGLCTKRLDDSKLKGKLQILNTLTFFPSTKIFCCYVTVTTTTTTKQKDSQFS